MSDGRHDEVLQESQLEGVARVPDLGACRSFPALSLALSRQCLLFRSLARLQMPAVVISFYWYRRLVNCVTCYSVTDCRRQNRLLVKTDFSLIFSTTGYYRHAGPASNPPARSEKNNRPGYNQHGFAYLCGKRALNAMPAMSPVSVALATHKIHMSGSALWSSETTPYVFSRFIPSTL